tara:strand:+ start:573 stop:794 length:222 start_codon:yes stop_codon:yes gene_type:complete
MSKRKRTAWRIEDLAEWLSRYDEIHKAGTDRAPYNYETWILIVKDVALDYADYMKRDTHTVEHITDLQEEANG